MGLVYGAQCDTTGCKRAIYFRWDVANKGKLQAQLRKQGWSFGKKTKCPICNALNTHTLDGVKSTSVIIDEFGVSDDIL